MELRKRRISLEQRVHRVDEAVLAEKERETREKTQVKTEIMQCSQWQVENGKFHRLHAERHAQRYRAILLEYIYRRSQVIRELCELFQLRNHTYAHAGGAIPSVLGMRLPDLGACMQALAGQSVRKIAQNIRRSSRAPGSEFR